MRMLFAVILLVGCGSAPSATDGGTKAFGETCTVDGDCASNVCFVGGTRSYCSLKCTVATQTADCPMPPTLGTCNNQGFCKAP